MIENLTYFWGLFESPEGASREQADTHAALGASEIPPPVVESFEREQIADLEGEFGARGAGAPTEIDHLEYTVGGVSRTILVINRGLSLLHDETPELLRLHRFLSVLQREAR